MRRKNDTSVLYVINTLSVGGAQRVLCEQVKNIDSGQFTYDVLVAEHRQNNALTQDIERKVPVQYLNFDAGRLGVKKIFRVRHKINEFHPNIVNSHIGGNEYAVIWALTSKGHLIITVHTSPCKAFTARTEGFVRIALKMHKVILVTVSEENHIATKQYFQIGDDQCRVINNGIDINAYYKKPHEKFTFINVARQDLNKNQKLIIDCFSVIHSQYRNTQLILLGDGPEHEHLISQVRDLGLDDVVQLPGNTDNPSAYYAVSDCYLQASHREALPMSVLEAMATGLPIISTDVGGLCDIVHKDNGVLVPDEDKDAYIEGMKQIFNSSEEDLRQYGEASKRYVQAYSSKKMMRQYEALYQEITNNR